MTATVSAQKPIRTTIPARIDRLGWSPFHTHMIVALGTAWILDGLEITIASSVSGVLTQSDTLDMSSTQVGLIATVYLAGEVVGALVFGKLSDRMGRRRLFMVTLGIYLVGSGLTALTFGHGAGWVAYLYVTRFIAGLGIGGEYAAINSAIDEMMPARYRGRVDVWVNGTYWAGSIIGTMATLTVLNALPENEGWRVGFLLGPILAVVILFVRRNLPESPRWLVTHGQTDEAERSVAEMEHSAEGAGQILKPVSERDAIVLQPQKSYGYLTFLRLVFRQYGRRAVLAASLMISQSFLYNAIFFTYALVLTHFYGVDASRVPIYGLVFAVGNLAGPLILGHLFDVVGRRKMISGTYVLSGLLLAGSAWLFDAGHLDSETQTLVWVGIFFFASAGASAAYLTASEIFPVEIRAEVIAVFFAIAQVFGALGPVFYGALIGDGDNRSGLFVGYLIGGAIMIIGGLIEWLLGVDAERKSLETVAKPLTAVGE